MKICCISDTHGQHRLLDMSKYPADVLVFAGDWTKGYDIGLSETSDFLSWLDSTSYNHKLVICGNHETGIVENRELFEDLLLMYPDITYLENSEATIDGIKFYGSPYSNEFGGWPFMYDESRLKQIWNKIPNDTQVLITHGPAYGCNDRVRRAYGRDPHVGSQSLAARKEALSGTLKAHISGHIHEAAGTVIHETCVNVCASVLNEKYNLINGPTIMEIT